MLKDKKRFYRNLFMIIGLLAANLLFFLTIWLANKYDDVSLDQFIYQMKSSAAGANRSLANSAVIRVGLFGIAATALEILVYMTCSGCFRERLKRSRVYIKFFNSRISRLITRRAVAFVLSVLVLSVSFFTLRLDVVSYVSAVTTNSTFIEDTYVDPREVALRFPENKRNLIYIFLESMEVAYSDASAGAIKISVL